MDDVMLQSLKKDLGGMRARIVALESEVQQLRRVRDAKLDTFLQVRWCITCLPKAEDEEDEPEYPTSGNVFPIKFLDAHFTPTPGSGSLVKTERSEEAVTLGYCQHYLPIDTPCPVFWKRGLGSETAGEWWLLDMGTPIYRGRTSGRINKGDSGSVTRFIAGTSTPDDPPQTDNVYNDYIDIGDDKIVHYAPDGDRLYLFAVECPPDGDEDDE